MQLLTTENAETARIFAAREGAVAETAMDRVPGFVGLAKVGLVPSLLDLILDDCLI